MNKIDLQEKIDILYNFAYENVEIDLTEKINGNINLKDIKFTSKSKFINNIKEQSLSNVSFVNFLPFSNTIVLNSKNLPITLFLNPYLNKKDPKDNKNPFNIDSAISYLFSPLVINKIVPNLLLPLINFDINFNKLPSSLLTVPIFTSLKKKISKKKFSEIISVRVRENFNKMSSLHTRISNSSSKNKLDLKPIIFQVIYSLAKIEKEYPGFRHNSLDSYNIFLNNTVVNTKYTYNGKNYYLDINENYVKIGNFSNSYIPQMFKSSSVEDKKYTYMKNKSFDVHYFLNTLINRDIKLNKIKDKDELINFIDRILPKKLRGTNKNKYYLNSDAKMKSYKEIINDKYFEDYLIKTKQNINVKISKSQQKKLNKIVGLESSASETSQGVRQLKKKEMTGGYYDKNRPIKNNPNISNDKRQVFKKRISEQPRPREPALLLEQKVYNPVVTKPPRPQPVAPFIPINQHNGMPLVNYPYPYSKIHNKVPIQKIYNITIGDPGITGNFIGEFYEDMLPDAPYPLNSLTLKDRIKLRGYVRNLLIEERDGEVMNITGGEKSFRKYVKWGPFNPYSLKNNPYEDCATRFCIYSAFYPMRYDNEKKVFNIAKDATSFNIRAYDLSIGSLYSDRLSEELKLENFNVFRDLTYYKYILSEIINKKVSPNFVNMILYKTDTATKIKYDKLVEFKLRHLPKALRNFAYKPLNLLANIDEQIENAKIFIKTFEQDYLKKILTKHSNKYKTVDDLDATVLNEYIDKIANNPEYEKQKDDLLITAGLTLDDIKINTDTASKTIQLSRYRRKMKELRNMLYMFGLDKGKSLVNSLNKDKTVQNSFNKNLTNESDKSLIIMTEGPTHNILRWASPVYNKNGAQHIMTATGFHSEEAWMSVYFQIVHIMMVLKNHNIYFRELSLGKNIFIKDVYHDAGNLGYWKYVVNGLDYYVPNHGYIVMFDSSYSDKLDVFNMKNIVSDTEFAKTKGKEEYKILSHTIFPNTNFSAMDKEARTDTNVDDEEFISTKLETDIGKEILNPDHLVERISHMRGICPTENFIKTLRSIHNTYTDKKDLNDILSTYFATYLHTRIGTLLSTIEINNISLIPVRDLTKGKMVIYQERFGEYKWAMYIRSVNTYKHKIIVDHKGNERIVFLASLRSYPENLTIDQLFKKGHKYMEEDLLDTYVM